MKTIPKVQRGFSLITAIFLLVVLAGLGTMSVTFFTAQQQSSALDVLGSRAYQAARAGIEWGAYQVTVPNCPAGPSSIPMGGTLSSFSVNVWCSATAASEAAATITVYSISSVATQGVAGQSNYVERVMNATIASGVSSTDTGIIYQRESY